MSSFSVCPPPTPPSSSAPAPLSSSCLTAAVAKNGDVCISILHEPGEDKFGYEKPEERWLPIHTVETIMISVISMLADPNSDSPANVDAAVSIPCPPCPRTSVPYTQGRFLLLLFLGKCVCVCALIKGVHVYCLHWPHRKSGGRTPMASSRERLPAVYEKAKRWHLINPRLSSSLWIIPW